MNNQTKECAEWINIVVQLPVIYFRYSESKSSYTVYYIDCTLLFVLIRCFKKEHVFHCWTLNDSFDCDDVGTVTSHSEIK